MDDTNIFPSPEAILPRSSAFQDYSPFRNTNTPIVIDNGSSQLRAGWAGESDPRLQFDNIVARHKGGSKSKRTDVLLVGNDVHIAGMKNNSKTAFEAGVVTNTATLEHTLDYVFAKLGIDTEQVQHSIVMSEPLCNPSFSRKLVSELLFEGYQVPSVLYGVDALFSYHANELSFDAGMIISSGNVATSIIPLWGGRPALENAKRISYGGQQLSEYMLKLLQYKYSSFPHRVSVEQAQDLVKDHTYVALDYMSELRELTIPEKLKAQEHIIQFPYTAKVEVDAQEEADRLEKRKEQGRRLQEQAARMREEKLQEKEAYLAQLIELQSAKGRVDEDDYLDRLDEAGFEEEVELENAIKTTQAEIKRARNRMLGIEEPEEKVVPSFPLVDVPDSELSEEQKKEKKKQRLLKASWDARERARIAKEEEKAREADAARQEEERRLRDPEGWLEEMRTKREVLSEKIKARIKKKTQLGDRRSRESKMRMKHIASLAAEETPGKRKRGRQDEDTFGAKDEDWGIYREISRQEESDEDEDLTELSKLDEVLMTYDPGFVPDNPLEEGRPFKETILFRLAHGPSRTDLTDPAVQNQIHLNVERIRVPEVFFQPSIVGLDQAGIVECFADILKHYDPAWRNRMAQSILVTGGNTLFPNFVERLERDIRALRPYGSTVKIKQAANPRLDAWKGASKIAREALTSNNIDFTKRLITRSTYEEYGHDYLKEHSMSNRFWGPAMS